MRFAKEFVIIAVILVIVIGLEIVTNNLLNKSLDNLLSEIAYIENNLENEDINEKINNIKSEWKKDNDKLSLFIEHNELEKISNNIMIMEANIKSYEDNKIRENIAEIKFMVEHIKDKNKVKLKNIF